MALFTIADLHLSEGADKPMDIFGAAWRNHKSRLEAAWKSLVCAEDTVVVPGDISWGMRFDNAKDDLLFINSLPGKKIIGKGNHDYWWNTVTKLEALLSEIGADKISFLYNNAYKVGGKIVCGTRGWFPDRAYSADDEKIVLREAGRLRRSLEAGKALAEADEELIVFMHYPPSLSGVRCTPICDVLGEYGIARCYYGHLHGVSPQILDKSVGVTDLHLIAADNLGFTPLLIE